MDGRSSGRQWAEGGMEEDPLHPNSAAQIILQEVMLIPRPGCMSFMQRLTYKCALQITSRSTGDICDKHGLGVLEPAAFA